MDRIGTIKFLRRYPVKSMMGEDLSDAFISKTGVQGDRVFAFVDRDNPKRSFPWMTARQKPEMLLFRPRFLDPTFTKVEVETPEGKRFLCDDEFEKYLERRFGYNLSLKFTLAGMHDSRPLSLFGIQTLSALSKEIGINRLEHERFRANLYADWHNQKPYYEDALIGKTLKVGETARIRVDKKDPRCAIPTLDPRDGSSRPEILRYLEKSREGCVGVYCLIENEGIVKVNDPVYLV